jgi:hypothetical protein
MAVKSHNNAKKFVDGRKKKAKRFVFTASSLIKARAQQYVPIDTGALQNSSPVSKPEEIGGNIVRSTISYLQEYAKYLHDPKPGGKMDGWQPVIKTVGGGYNAAAKQGWLYIGAKEAKQAVDEAFRDLMKI